MDSTMMANYLWSLATLHGADSQQTSRGASQPRQTSLSEVEMRCAVLLIGVLVIGVVEVLCLFIIMSPCHWALIIHKHHPLAARCTVRLEVKALGKISC